MAKNDYQDRGCDIKADEIFISDGAKGDSGNIQEIFACPNGAISGKVKEPHAINPEKCLKCGACMEKCRFGAIYKE